MCVVSMVGDHFNDKWNPYFPFPQPAQPWQPGEPLPKFAIPVTREEFEQLRKDVLEMKELLKRAKLYDEQNNQPDCEMEKKIAALKEMAKIFGISLDDIFKPQAAK